MASPGRERRPPSVATIALFVALAAVAAAAAVGVDRVAQRQDRQLLRERAAEIVAIFGNQFARIEGTLGLLTTFGDDVHDREHFQEAAASLVGRSGIETVVLAEQTPDGVRVLDTVGAGPRRGELVGPAGEALASRALDENMMVTRLVDPPGPEAQLLVAAGADGRVAYLEATFTPGTPVPNDDPRSPFRALHVAIYTSTEPSPASLLVTTEDDLPLPGPVVTETLTVGADAWLVVVGHRSAGALARWGPWAVLAAGLTAALLAGALVQSVSRRRRFAEDLVEERTRELAETQRFTDQLVTAGPALVLRLQLDPRQITYVSPNAERLFGWSVEDVLSLDPPVSVVHADDRAALTAAVERVGAGGGSRELLECRLRDGQGRELWAQITVTADPQQPGSVLCYLTDIDARRRAEQAHAAAQREAEAANTAKSQFLSRMSHELRTPLNAVLGFGQLLELEPLTARQHDAVAHIVKAGRHLLDLINEVLDISRIESGDLTLSPEPVLVVDLVTDAAALVRPLAAERDVQIHVDDSSCGCHVYADRQRTMQVVLNLLANAVKYNRHRGSVSVSCAPDGDAHVAIEVRDTGAGIPAERLGDLFTPFERLGAEHTAEEGTGIGLALSQRLTEAMGGQITVASTYGKGSTFRVRLPRAEGQLARHERLHPPAAAAAPGPPVEGTGEPAHRVLYVEDNLSNLTLVEQVFAVRPDVEVLPAMQGRLGIDLARQHELVLVLLDMHLPDMDGLEVLHQLRDDPRTRALPIVVLSADVSPSTIRKVRAAGADDYVTKPADVRELLRILDDAVERATAEPRL